MDSGKIKDFGNVIIFIEWLIVSFTITSLKSSLKFKKITISLYFAAECIQAYND